MRTRLTILCENSVGAPFGVIGEHGFACFVETESGNYLFDTGQGFGIVPNAAALKKDLGSIQSVLISHGHYDHTGGLPAVLKIKGPTDVFGHPDMFRDRVWSSGNQTRFVGMPFKKGYLESLGATFRLDVKMVEIGPGVFLTGEIPRNTPFEKGDAHMTAMDASGKTIHPDPLNDDLSLIVQTENGLVLVLGCAHAGMINIIEYVLDKMADDRIYAIIGAEVPTWDFPATNSSRKPSRPSSTTVSIISACPIAPGWTRPPTFTPGWGSDFSSAVLGPSWKYDAVGPSRRQNASGWPEAP